MKKIKNNGKIQGIKKLTNAAVCSILSATMLAGCGGANTGAGANTSPAGEAPTQTPSDSEESQASTNAPPPVSQPATDRAPTPKANPRSPLISTKR